MPYSPASRVHAARFYQVTAYGWAATRCWTTAYGWLLAGLLCLPACQPAGPTPVADQADHTSDRQAIGGSATELGPGPLAASPDTVPGPIASSQQNSSQESRHPSFETQLAAVQSGQADAIQLVDQPITETQVHQLHAVSHQLRDLILDAGGLSDPLLPLLAQLSELEHLRIRESPLSDAAIQAAFTAENAFQQLRILNIPQTPITAAGLVPIAALPKLSQLRLGGSQLDDAAVQVIAKSGSLRSLHLISPNLTDLALDYLAESPGLTSLYVDDCPLNDDAWQRLFTAKPNLHVHVDQQHHDRDPHPHEH
ncbi:leucine-rich repeat domain-containing protein [Aureliella helgolandensis]|uniref:Leucine Rich repeats (2 copies) n=1 Tax=Aureliella helgolandensis TaxID=2527968 RepID=A0A518GES1_9BACT|nr:hypothetical protein [Aureliella helgolandensis]QDV27096.1 Leucine Rich repeats (2 copies) [Aureliella helgolandensis]